MRSWAGLRPDLHGFVDESREDPRFENGLGFFLQEPPRDAAERPVSLLDLFNGNALARPEENVEDRADNARGFGTVLKYFCAVQVGKSAQGPPFVGIEHGPAVMRSALDRH